MKMLIFFWFVTFLSYYTGNCVPPRNSYAGHQNYAGHQSYGVQTGGRHNLPPHGQDTGIPEAAYAEEEVDPCHCQYAPWKCGCTCMGYLTQDHLFSVSEKFQSCDKFSFKLMGGNFASLPPNFFSRIWRVKEFELEIANASFDQLFASAPSPFRGIGFDDRAVIRLRNVTVRRNWNWAALSDLKSSRGEGAEIDISHSRLNVLSPDFGKIASGKVKSVSIEDSGLERIDGGAFATFNDLRSLNLAHNRIRIFRRSNLPRSADNLMELNLSDNLIQFLQPDMFKGMPVLWKISLRGNPINEIREETFKDIIGKAFVEGLADFPLECDCRLQWLKDPSLMLNTMFRINMEGVTCKSPSYLRGSPFRSLYKEHLRCRAG